MMSDTSGNSASRPRSVTVTTGSRLHFGLLTHRPQSGREFGGIGVMIDSPGWQIAVSTSGVRESTPVPDLSRTGSVTVTVSAAAATACVDSEERVRRTLERWVQSTRTDVEQGSRSALPADLRVHVERAIPGHRGLGSGTQLGLAIGRALSLAAGEGDLNTGVLAERTGRGLRSAVGTWGFERGGLIVDGGKLPEQTVGTCVSRLEFPAEWRFLLIAPAGGYGLSGADEVAAFERLQGMPGERSQRLCRIALMDLLPAIAETDVAAASAALTEYGRVSGEYFSAVQGGVFADDRMADVGHLVTHRGRGFFQTSWGPTCAALCAGDEEAAELRRELDTTHSGPLVLVTARPLNRGALVKAE
ncbi:hypothetical protein GC176_09490 [bacterium]|nr:hypothetical protein [bacterium]